MSTIKRGSWVIVTDGQYQGMRGQVSDILKATKDYDRRAVVRLPSLFMPMIRLDYLTLDPEREVIA